MQKITAGLCCVVLGAGLGLMAASCGSAQPGVRSTAAWLVHAPSAERPPVVAPGTASTQDRPGRPPSDAIVLFDGTDLSAWQTRSGEAAPWKVTEGYLEIVPRSGSIFTRRAFGDVQLHLEWAAPDPPSGEGQGRGNSGIKFMGRYELQVLDSYENETYPDGQAAAVYSQYPPLVNASRPPGQWQSYDVVFRRPHFAPNGEVLRPARITAFHNGVLVQDAVVLTGPTGGTRPPYSPHEDRLPLMLQDHGNPVRFRNIWIREL